jgi:hypothetical protein
MIALVLLLTAAAAGTMINVTSTNSRLYNDGTYIPYGGGIDPNLFPLQHPVYIEVPMIYDFYGPLLHIQGGLSATVDVSVVFGVIPYLSWDEIGPITLTCEILIGTQVDASLSNRTASFNNPVEVTVDEASVDADGSTRVLFTITPDNTIDLSDGIVAVIRADTDVVWVTYTPLGVPPTVTFTFHPVSVNTNSTLRGPSTPSHVFEYSQGAFSDWVPPLMPIDSDYATVLSIPGLAGPSSDVMTIDIRFSHNISSFVTGQRLGVKIHVLVEQENASCAFPLDAPTCTCQAIAALLFDTYSFAMSTTISCSQDAVFNGNVTIAQILPNTPSQLIVFYNNGDPDGFPLLQAPDRSNITVGLLLTDFRPPTTTAPSTMSTTPPAVPEFEAAKLGGRGTRVALFTTVAAAAAVSATLVGLAVRFLK